MKVVDITMENDRLYAEFDNYDRFELDVSGKLEHAYHIACSMFKGMDVPITEGEDKNESLRNFFRL